jgi:4-oxalmesaconate hydratase
MIIDCHGHYTTAPPAHQRFRDAQLARLEDPALPVPAAAAISDDEIRESVEGNQLRIARERGTGLTVFSPRASGMGHHVAGPATARSWARACNDLVFRVTELFPASFAGAAQLPQVAGEPLDACVAELERCVTQLGFVGANVNPDPSGGYWSSPPVTDEYWFPLWEKLTELDVPAMIHVSASCNPAAHTLGAHYLNADTTVFMQLISGDLFGRFPGLRFVIPHGGGAVPCHWGRYQGLVIRERRPPIETHVLGNVFFDSCVYHQPGIDLLTKVIPARNILFASEMLGAVRGDNPETGASWDDTKRYLDQADLPEADRAKIYEANARRVYPRLDARLKTDSSRLAGGGSSIRIRPRSGWQRGHHAFLLGVAEDLLQTGLLAEAALLVPSERHAAQAPAGRVEQSGARLDPAADGRGALEAPGDHPGTESVLGGVGDPDRLVGVFVPHH